MIEKSTAPMFQVGKVYDRWSEINGPYGGSRQSGISASKKTSAIFLFTGSTGEKYGYEDKFDADGVFHYAGEGQLGDMSLTRGNRAIVDHASDGRALHLFTSLGHGKGQKYVGDFVYANHAISNGVDREGKQRKIIVFHLVPVSLANGMSGQAAMDDESLANAPLSLPDARTRALNALQPPEGLGGQVALRVLYHRSQCVRDYVLQRAAGFCECCKKPAPFVRPDGSPYLEPHHTTRLSDGGLDHPRFVAAVCPACHREIHFGREGTVKNTALLSYLGVIEPGD
jgi:5-methylcytosine-specific restriction protein A